MIHLKLKTIYNNKEENIEILLMHRILKILIKIEEIENNKKIIIGNQAFTKKDKIILEPQIC